MRLELLLRLPSADVDGGASVIVVDCVQRSEAWRRARCGFLTASNAHVVVARGRRGDESIARVAYRRQLVFEQLTGTVEPDRFAGTDAMRRGLAREPAARLAYEQHRGRAGLVSGFVHHDELKAGASLDWHTPDFRELAEFKCPEVHTHWAYWLTRAIPRRYRLQMIHQLWITGAERCDFVSYHPGAPLVVIRLERVAIAADLARYELAARAFLSEIGEAVSGSHQVVDYFRTAPLDVAYGLLKRCERALHDRRRARLAAAA